MNNKQNYEQSKLFKIRHSAEHVLTQAMFELGYKFYMAMGPATEDGFYFDFELLKGKITENDFEKIEVKMQEIVDRKLIISKKIVNETEARNLFKENPYKNEWIDKFVNEKQELSVYYTGNPDENNSFVDLCSGPHVNNTEEIKAFKLLSIAGAYWHGDEKNKMLTRIYGTAFETQQELENYLKMIEQAKLRDHRKLGKELELFMFHETSPGMPYWLPKGLIIYNNLIKYWRDEHKKYQYQEISSPLLNKQKLYEISGHWDHYKDDMFIANMGENEVYGIKPMNCPNAMIVFGSKTRSYKDLPLRLSDTDKLHRYERSGTLNGLLRVRSFQQDDSHNFITEDMIESEYLHVFEMCENFYSIFGMEYYFRLGTRPEGFLGKIETWDKAEQSLKKVLNKSGKKYEVLEKDGAFYGPKVDILMKDAIGREWQMGTIQLDFQQPARFNLKYINENGKEVTPITIHRVIYGSLERFIGIIIEHFAGNFPVWLSPEQVNIIPISDAQGEYAKAILEKLLKNNIRASINFDAETMQNKIRKAQEQKIPYMIIVGKKEVEKNQISVRLRTGENKNNIQIEDFVKSILKTIETKSLVL